MVFFHGGAFQRGTAVCLELGRRLGKDQSSLCPGSSPVSWEQDNSFSHSRRLSGVIS